MGKLWKDVSEDDRAPFQKKAAAQKATYTSKKEQSVWWKALGEKERQPWVEKAAAAKKKYQAKLERYMKTADYQSYVTARDEYKSAMLAKRNKLMGIKKRARTPAKADASKKHKRSVSRSRSA